jgi:hypothetical protein
VQVKSSNPSISGPLHPSAPLLAHWHGHALFEHRRPLQPWFQQVQWLVPQSASRVQICPTAVRQRPP